MNLLKDILGKYKKFEFDYNQKKDFFIKTIKEITGYSINGNDFVFKNNTFYIKNQKLKTEIYIKKHLILEKLTNQFSDIVFNIK